MKSILNISIDDVCPHPLSSIRVLDRCHEIIKSFPNVKFTLFIPMAYTRLNEDSYYIDKYPDFVKQILSLNKENFEIGWHGMYHGIRGVSNKDEFKALNYKDALILLKEMFLVANRCGIYEKFKPIFRPPAMSLSPDSFDACKELKIEILALSFKESVKRKIYGNKDAFFKDVVYFDCSPPELPLKIEPFKTEIIYHACEWMKNYLDLQKTSNLISFLEDNKNNVEFGFMNDIIIR